MGLKRGLIPIKTQKPNRNRTERRKSGKLRSPERRASRKRWKEETFIKMSTEKERSGGKDSRTRDKATAINSRFIYIHELQETKWATKKVY